MPRPTKREQVLWAELWRTPQAIMWAGNGQELEVALYVRSLRDAESPKASVASRTLILRQQEYLGLSQPGLARNHWIIVDDAAVAPDAPAEGSERPIPISDARDRLNRIRDAG